MNEQLQQFQLYLFDFDGLLVNTEELHYRAYQKMCSHHRFTLDWDFPTYCQAAHYDADGLRRAIYKEFPKLEHKEPNWDRLYAQKKQALVDLVLSGEVHLMPGVHALLTALDEEKIPHCVVTHSPDNLVQAIRDQNPILNTIPRWFTREDYSHPKPHPECYLKAIEELAGPNDRVIGFEDTPRGLRALLQTRAQAVLVTEVPYPEIPPFLEQGAWHFSSLGEWSHNLTQII